MLLSHNPTDLKTFYILWDVKGFLQTCSLLGGCPVSNGYQVDFLSFTLPFGHLPEAFKLLDGFDLKSKEKGLYGYCFSYVAPGCTVLYSPDRPDVHVQLSGRGCDLFDVLSLPDHAKITRLDIAFDSFDGAYTVDDVRGCLLRGQFGGTARHITGFVGFTREAPGQTLYIGSPKSDARIRIYDKASEQGISPEQREGYCDWTRFELQLRGDVAKVAYAQLRKYSEGLGLVSSLASLFASYIRSMFYVATSVDDLEKQGKHGHRSRAACPLWLSMFSRFSEKRPKVQRKNADLHNLTRYVLGAASAFKALRVAVSSFDRIFEEAVEAAAFELKHEELLIDYVETDYFDMFEHGYNPVPLRH